MFKSLRIAAVLCLLIVIGTKLLEAVTGLHYAQIGSFPLAENIAIPAAFSLFLSLMFCDSDWIQSAAISLVAACALFGLVVFTQDALGALAVTSLGDEILLESIAAAAGIFLGLELPRRRNSRI